MVDENMNNAKHAEVLKKLKEAKAKCESKNIVHKFYYQVLKKKILSLKNTNY